MGNLYWDPYDIEIDSDPHPIWRRMRDEKPVYYNDPFDFYALSRHADVEAAHRMPLQLSSAHGTVLELMTPAGEPIDVSRRRLIVIDPPEHDRLRALVSRAFTIRRVAELESEIRAMCASALDPQVGAGGFDYLADFGSVLPSKVISALLGVPESEREEVRSHIDRVFHIEPGVGMINDVSITAGAWLRTYLAAQLAERRVHPHDDMMTALVQVEIDEGDHRRRLSDDEATSFAMLLLGAGTETTARLLGWAAVLLAEHPDERAFLVDQPGAIGHAIEEILRFEAPSPVQGRTATTDLEFHGVTIPAGSRVLLLTGSAGRDERKYDNPNRFRVRREFDGHLAFGHGIHFCVGAALARLEARVALEETLRRFPKWDIDYTRAERLHTSTVRGWARVPVLI